MAREIHRASRRKCVKLRDTVEENKYHTSAGKTEFEGKEIPTKYAKDGPAQKKTKREILREIPKVM